MSIHQNSTQQLWVRRFFILLGLVLVWRIIYIALVPLDLTPDESYYWDWSRRLDWGYFSKPPMVAWINALSTGLLGAHTFVVRLPAAILSCVAVLGVFLLGRAMFDARTGFWAAVLSLAGPGSAALGFIMTIDAPLMACWSMGLYFLWRNIQEDKFFSRWTLPLGITMGLGMLSKEMMLTFPLIMILTLLVTPGFRRNLARPWPWIAAVLALAMITPTILWNLRQGWITATHSASHISSPSGSFFDFLVTFPEFMGSQLLIISPLTFLLYAVLAVSMITGFRALAPEQRFLFMFSVPALAVFTLLSFHQGINPNWPAVFYPSGMILLAAWGCAGFDLRPGVDDLRRFFIPAVKVGAGFAVLTYALPLLIQVLSLTGTGIDPTSRLQGWKELGTNADQVMQGVPRPDKTLVIAAERRQLPSSLAFYMQDQPVVYRWTSSDRISSQYELWPGPVDRIGWDALIAMRADRGFPNELKDNFEEVVFLENIGHASGRDYKVYLGLNLLRWE
jgi:4-amino-4-deoxy-L-arabinose transferase-like glycosyltransferase